MSGMKIIKPTAVTSASLISSSVPEPDVDEMLWVATKNYAVNEEAIRTETHGRYARKVPGISATPPESDSANWRLVGPTNRFAMFDRKVGTASTSEGSVSVTIQAGGVSGLGALELVGSSASVMVKDAPGGTVVYERDISLDGTLVNSVYDWLFSDFEQLTDFVLTDLPQHYTNAEVSFAVFGATASVGVLQVGQVLEIGGTEYGAKVGIIDFSKKNKDEFGNSDLLEREYSKTGSFQVMTAKADFNKIYRRLASLRATPCIYIGVDAVGFEPMIIYGWYRDFGIAVPYPTRHLLNIEIEGL